MNAELPDPVTQAGLLGYLVFDSLVNKQGNPLYNGKLEGLAAIAQTNTTCNSIPDSCDVFEPLKYIALRSAQPLPNEAVTLNWETEAESGIQTYTIQRSESPSFLAIH